MELSYDTIQKVLEHYESNIIDHCSNYGEPGYSFPIDATTPLVVLGDYWCRCGKVLKDDGSPDLHDLAHHYPRLWARMEAQGVQFEWYDEWTVDYDNDKAYRTQPNSYSWQPTAVFNEDTCEYLTPDDDPETWIEWAVDNTSRCIPSRVLSAGDLEEIGFVSFNGRFESGWHDGQTDDPKEIYARIREDLGDAVEVVFLLDESSQFYIGFSAWTRDPEADDMTEADWDTVYDQREKEART